MICTLFRNELRGILRDGRGAMILALGALLSVVASWTATSTDQRERQGHAEATEQARAAWLEREPDNPHSRAHYGDFVFRPSGPLAGLDSGLQLVTGRSIRVEAHRQNAAVHVPHREASSLLRFDRLEPSTVLHLVLPLILVLVGFGLVATERETGRLRLLQIQGARPLPLLLAKSLALWTVGAVLCVLVIGTHVAFADGVEVGRTSAYLAVHLLVLWVVAVLVTSLSSRFRRPGPVAGVLLSLWVLGSIVLPRLGAMTASAASPLPGRDAFNAAMQEDREKGLDGHNPRDERRQALEEQILEEYGVADRKDLPINIGGLLMQADEEYGNQVWDQHFGDLEAHLQEQSAIARGFSLINPLHATDRLSMAVAGTGLHGHLAFLRQAEAYRRTLVKSLNDEDAFGGARTGERGWTATPEFYASFETFEYDPPDLGSLLGDHLMELAALVAWALGATGFLVFSARRLEAGGSL